MFFNSKLSQFFKVRRVMKSGKIVILLSLFFMSLSFMSQAGEKAQAGGKNCRSRSIL